MASSQCFFSPQICVSFKVDQPRLPSKISRGLGGSRAFAPKGMASELSGQKVTGKVKHSIGWSFLGGSKTIGRPNHGRISNPGRKSLAVNAAWLPSSEVVADMAFTVGTAAVLPFYTCMVVAPQAEITKKLMASSIPYMVLGTLYAYLLYLSWTPDTIRLIFATKYLLPELSGIAKMFSSEMTLASAWIHLLAVDLYAARQVYRDGLLNDVETRHSVTLCLLFCPIGILVHFITNALSRLSRKHGNVMTK